MAKIFTYLTSQAKSLSTYATNPLWQVVDGPYKLSAYNTTSGAFTMVPNTTYGGPHVTPQSYLPGCSVHFQHRGIQRHQGGQRRRRLH